ncbi:MAG TPA: hypothetical protein VMS37_36325 [Verrucomicrobiae bacterium]|nr:hypothetical protein [Verrucomicrobiae bacterium]
MSQILPRKLSARAADTNGARCGEETICLYGWDSRSRTWHGPNELGPGAGRDRRLLQSLRAAPGKSWYGAVSCGTAGERATRFFALVHDLADCAVASIYCDESKAGPAEIVAVVPASRRAGLREEFAFEFLAFARFLGALGAGDEVQVHDAIAAACAEQRDARAVVFSMSSGTWPSDLDPVLSCCVEKVAVTLCEWMDGAGMS